MIRKLHVLTLSALSVLALFAASSQAQITPSQDAYTNSADPTTNFGANVLLDVDGASQITYIQFNLASVPSGASVSQATLKLYVNAVGTAGSFNVDYVNGAWSESTITHNLSPVLGNTIVSGVAVSTADKNQYILINVTSAVEAWLGGSQANDGIALVADSTFNASFDSKENTGTSHSPELDIVFAGGDGTITGVTTATGSGLAGGGTSGTLNLSLLKTCTNGQVLEWNGSAWACATAKGTGTITGVTAGTDLTGGGNGGKVTLNLDTTKVPQLNAVNTFTGNQGVIGTITATGSVGIGTSSPGASLDVFSSTAGIHAAMGRFGSQGANDCNSILTYTSSGTAEIFQAGASGCFIPGAAPGDSGLRVSPGNRILLGDSSANRVLIDAAGNVEQNTTSGGLVKAMFFFSPNSTTGAIVSCYNSTFSGAAATTPPCGFSIIDKFVGDYIFDLGFQIDNRFFSATGAASLSTGFVSACTDLNGQFGGGNPTGCQNFASLTPNRVEVTSFDLIDCGSGGCSLNFFDDKIYLIVY